jgi:hypothetical protein
MSHKFRNIAHALQQLNESLQARAHCSTFRQASPNENNSKKEIGHAFKTKTKVQRHQLLAPN